jgi:hypothetical protein
VTDNFNYISENLTPSKIVSARELREMLAQSSSSTPPETPSRQPSSRTNGQQRQTPGTASAVQEQHSRHIVRDSPGPAGFTLSAPMSQAVIRPIREATGSTVTTATLQTASRSIFQGVSQPSVLPAGNALTSLLQSSKAQKANEFFNSVLQGHSAAGLRGNTNVNPVSVSSVKPSFTAAVTTASIVSGKAPASKVLTFSMVRLV